MNALCTKCGKNPRRKSHVWCQPCHNLSNRKYVAAYRSRHREKFNEIKRAWDRTHPKEGAARQRQQARMLAHKALQSGRLIAEPCRLCGAKAEMHHSDYSKPYDVEWLCRAHHVERHGGGMWKDYISGEIARRYRDHFQNRMKTRKHDRELNRRTENV